jgi:DNA repair exonuclease SbcCD nuclease subunit
VAFRFIHAADIHLDSPLRSLALRDAALAELIGTATRQAFTKIIDICLDEQVDALVLAGDLYDGGQTSMKTARFLADQIGRLHEAGMRTFVIRGNHDALSKITPELVWPDSVKVYRGIAEAVPVQRAATDVPIHVHGVSFAQPLAPESLLGKYKPAVPGAINIGILHTSLGGALGHDRYSPCSVADLRATGFNYWALGHIHSRSIDARAGAGTIVMPGMPQGRDIGEAGAKSVTLVTIHDDRSVTTDERFTSVAQFERLTIDVAANTDWPDLIRRLGRHLSDARTAVNSNHLVVRLRLTGQTPLAWQIRRDRDLLRAELDKLCETIGFCWIEQIEIGCTAPDFGATAAGHPLAELRGLIDAKIIGASAFRSEIAAIANDLLDHLPPESRRSFGDDEATLEATLARLADEGIADVLARLHGNTKAEAV